MFSVNPVLIVDDEAPVRRLLRRWAEAEGADVFEASTAEEAVEVASAISLAVAFCDYHLPEKDGLWLARQLREKQRNAAVVMATGVIDADVVKGGLHSGAVDYLIKPFTRERVSQALRWALHTHATRTRLAQASGSDTEPQRTADSHVSAILAMIRVQDPEAHDHARRVARLARELAEVLNVAQSELSEIERSALLHDVGLITVRETEMDWQSVLQSPCLEGSLSLVSAVHRIGGPEDDVPVGARIIRVADGYDELVSGVFGPAETPSRAMEILCTERVLEFDPRVLGALRSIQPGRSVS